LPARSPRVRLRAPSDPCPGTHRQAVLDALPGACCEVKGNDWSQHTWIECTGHSLLNKTISLILKVITSSFLSQALTSFRDE
jgi:hypothetical protein